MYKKLPWSPIQTNKISVIKAHQKSCLSLSREEGSKWLPANMMIIMQKLTYKLRDKWRTVRLRAAGKLAPGDAVSDITNSIVRELSKVGKIEPGAG